MNTPLDPVLDRVTMYRLVLYVLLALVGIAAVLAGFGLLSFSPLALLGSAAFLVALCWAANAALARVFGVPTNIESALITGLILSLILDPARSFDDLLLLGWAALLAMASKYILGLGNKHIFNPAAIAVVLTSLVLKETASWWVGTASMLPAVLIGGVLIVRKVRQEAMVALFLALALITVVGISLMQRLSLVTELQQLFVFSPVFFVAAIMLTEPLTAPPTLNTRMLYGALVGALIVPQIHVGSLYSTPELALVAGNLFSYAVSPRQRVALRLKRKSRLSPSIVAFTFLPSHPLTFTPGQYLELTLSHARPDSRGNRRYFTIASSPTEQGVHLGVRFYEHGSSFKRALRAVDARSVPLAGQVSGDFTLPRDPQRKLLFIAGGIGITPYRSMLKYLVDTKERRDIVVLYANRTADEIVYRDILSEAQARLGTRVIYTLTDTTTIPRDWTGERGHINAEMIRTAAPDYRERTFYLSGPPAMVKAYERVLRGMGVSRWQIKRDFFPGLV